MKKLVGLLLAGLAMISMTFMSCSADTDSSSAPKFEVTYGTRTDVQDSITVDLTTGKASVYLFSDYYDKLEVFDAFIEETDDAIEFELGRPSKTNKNVKVDLEDFLNYVSEPGEYTIVLLIACDGVIDEYELAITVLVKNGNEPVVTTPTITTNLPTDAKVNDTLTVVASVTDGTVNYQWYKDGVVIPSATQASYTATEKGTYYVRVSNAADSTKYVDSTSTRVTDPNVPDVVEITAQPTALVIANLSSNSSQLLSAAAKSSNNNAISAQWFKDGQSVSGVENGTGSITSTYKPMEFGSYICKFTSGGDTVATNVVEVTEAPISQGLVIDGIMKGVAVRVGSQLKVTPRSDVPCTYTYQWWAHGETSGDDTEIEGATSDTFEVVDLNYNNVDISYGISCRVTFNSTQSAKSIVRDSERAIFTKSQPGDPVAPVFKTNLSEEKKCYVGENVELKVEATVTDSGTVTYQWFKNGGAISGATDSTYKVDTSEVGEFRYTVVAYNNLDGKQTAQPSGVTTVVKVAAVDNNGNITGGFDFN